MQCCVLMYYVSLVVGCGVPSVALYTYNQCMIVVCYLKFEIDIIIFTVNYDSREKYWQIWQNDCYSQYILPT